MSESSVNGLMTNPGKEKKEKAEHASIEEEQGSYERHVLRKPDENFVLLW